MSESAANYVSVLQAPEEAVTETDQVDQDSYDDYPTAFSLARFIPLLTERIHVINPFTRMFLVSWITLLDSIPDLELAFYLPAFLGGLFKFLSDPNKDVHVATQGALERFLAEIKQIALIKKGIEDNRKAHTDESSRQTALSPSASAEVEAEKTEEKRDDADDIEGTGEANDEDDGSTESDWVPGQDVFVDHPKILEILVSFLDSTAGVDTTDTIFSHVTTNYRHAEEEIQLTALRWIDSFFEICPEDILPFVPRLLSQVLPAMASDVDDVRKAAHRVNTSLLEYIVSLSEEPLGDGQNLEAPLKGLAVSARDSTGSDRRDTAAKAKSMQTDGREADGKRSSESGLPSPPIVPPAPSEHQLDLDYTAAISALTLQFSNEHETTRAAALTWLIMLHRKAPRKVRITWSRWRVTTMVDAALQVLAINDETFPALLKTLSDPAEAVVTQDLQLLSQISNNSDDDYFTSFMVNLLQLFCTDRRLLETRGNLIIRQLCVNLSAERIYRTLADCLEKDEVSQGIFTRGLIMINVTS